jgi:hypothetical protein
MLDYRLRDSSRLQQLNISASNIQLLSSRLRYLNNGEQPTYHMKPTISQPPAKPNIGEPPATPK